MSMTASQTILMASLLMKEDKITQDEFMKIVDRSTRAASGTSKTVNKSQRRPRRKKHVPYDYTALQGIALREPNTLKPVPMAVLRQKFRCGGYTGAVHRTIDLLRDRGYKIVQSLGVPLKPWLDAPILYQLVP